MGLSFDESLAIESERSAIEARERWKNICNEIEDTQGIHFDPEWEVKCIPPFGGSMARFVVYHNNKRVSVYLDWYSRLGWVVDDEGEPLPYYEIYPSKDGDVERFGITETDNMVRAIRESLESQENH